MAGNVTTVTKIDYGFLSFDVVDPVAQQKLAKYNVDGNDVIDIWDFEGGPDDAGLRLNNVTAEVLFPTSDRGLSKDEVIKHIRQKEGFKKFLKLYPEVQQLNMIWKDWKAHFIDDEKASVGHYISFSPDYFHDIARLVESGGILSRENTAVNIPKGLYEAVRGLEGLEKSDNISDKSFQSLIQCRTLRHFWYVECSLPPFLIDPVRQMVKGYTTAAGHFERVYVVRCKERVFDETRCPSDDYHRIGSFHLLSIVPGMEYRTETFYECAVQ